ncbi:hypothetical protein JCM19235_4431 [Vibrio maritimus]|uniref:Uncharacterized protein n=1 Tax=Vibrio maritimus TaxID=990268 RepID=A0A090RY62_9VIBR|nr:hypothetical protein JCM19235_4431 [Vibrio maritimus]
MQSVNSNLPTQTQSLGNKALTPNLATSETSGNTLPTKQGDSVSISPQAKALLEQEAKAEQKAASNEKANAKEEEGMSKSVQSFAHGALGMDHPDDLKEQEDTSYSLGQYASAAVTIGALILALA